MINLILSLDFSLVAFIGILFAFVITCVAISKLNHLLPKDLGRQFAHDGKLSAGKPRGAGIIFVLTFAVAALLFARLNVEIAIYLVLIIIEMLTGYFDDAAEKPWNEYLKGILDLAVAVAVALVYLHYNSSEVVFAIFGTSIVLPPIVFAILTVVLVWASINVTNCTDGVDGLSGTLTIITIMTIFVLNNILGVKDDFNFLILLFVVCLLGYLWYNATPSKLLMGDAGSRAMGIFIAIAVTLLTIFVLNKTSLGMKIRMVGTNPANAEFAGINPKHIFMKAMMLSGALGGIAGCIEVLGVHGYFLNNFASGLGTNGMLAALIANNNIITAPIISFFIAILKSGAMGMQQATSVPKSLVDTITAVFIIFACMELIGNFKKKSAKKADEKNS